ncbi:MAG: putative colanic acid biosynthesis acetyltransferase [Spirosomataceae bacterium]
MTEYFQNSPYNSPWSIKKRIVLLLWEYTWLFLCSWTPKPANKWRLFWLKLFGANIHGTPFVHQRARIQIPWNLTLYDRACLGDRTNAYSLGKIEIHEHATVAQEAYLCTGTHAFDKPSMNLITKPIVVESYAFIGARTFVMCGVTIGEGAVIGACSLVTKDMPHWTVCAGNPCKPIKKRILTNP